MSQHYTSSVSQVNHNLRAGVMIQEKDFKGINRAQMEHEAELRRRILALNRRVLGDPDGRSDRHMRILCIFSTVFLILFGVYIVLFTQPVSDPPAVRPVEIGERSAE